MSVLKIICTESPPLHSFRLLLVLILTAAYCSLLTGCTGLGIKPRPTDQLAEKYVNENSSFIEIRGAKVHVRESGTGPPLVLLHGVTSSLHTWEGWAEILGSSFRVIRVDAPGHGLTGDMPGFTYDEAGLVRFMEEFVEAMELKSFYLAGNSLGGFTAWNYAVEHPERVKKLILLDPAGYPPQDTPWVIRLTALPGAGFFARHITPRFIVAKNVREVYGNPERIKESVIDRYYELLLYPGNRDAMVKIFRKFVKRSRDPELGVKIKRLQVPVLLMWGEKDKWVPPEHVKKWKRDVPGLKVVTYPGAGHIPMEEIPERTAADALKFLRQAP